MSIAANKPPRFEWDHEVPQDAFWRDLPPPVSRGFLQCYTTTELSNMRFDESLPAGDRINFLEDTLIRKLETLQKADHDPDYNMDWRKLLVVLSAIKSSMGEYGLQEAIARERYENAPGGVKDLSALHELSGIMERTGRYAEGEKMALEVLAWMDHHEKLGQDSPQAVSSALTVASCVWKLKHFEEGQKWLDDCRSRVAKMGVGRFAKYYDEEKERLDEVVGSLLEWKKAA